MVPGSACVFRSDLFRTAAFRLTLGLVCVVVLGMLLELVLLYGQISTYEQLRTNDLLRRSASVLMQEAPGDLEVRLKERSTSELRIFLNAAALFDKDHHPIAGDMTAWPAGLVPSQSTQNLSFVLPDHSVTIMRFLVVEVPGMQPGKTRLLVLGRSRHMVDELRRVARQCALFSMVPVVLFALTAGMILSRRALGRISKMHHSIEQIVKGQMRERLPVGRGHDDLDRLAGSVNRMLDRLEQLMGEMRDVGNDIAHDLRTPLARVQARLERVSSFAQTLEAPSEECERFEQAMNLCQRDLEQCFSVITALLRIGEIENGQRRAGFRRMDIMPLIADMADLYEPNAETEGLTLSVVPHEEPVELWGDADLLNEVLANLLDNALKFTDEGGSVTLRAGYNELGEPWFEVRDTGVGIAVEERKVVMSRFYRADKSRHIPGSGLGLSLVAAIVRLHEARLVIEENCEGEVKSGTVFRLIFPALKENYGGS